MSSNATTAVRSASPTTRVVIGIVPSARDFARAQWLEVRRAELLPVPYFHVVFTVPAQIADIALQNKAVVYAILFQSAAETVRTIAADPRHLGAEIGMVSVLHTWGQNLHHHPHIHAIVLDGGLSPDGQRWVACRPGFFLPVRVLSRLFRRLFLERLKAAFDAGLLGFFGGQARLSDPAAFRQHLGRQRALDWVVYAKRPFGGPEQVLDWNISVAILIASPLPTAASSSWIRGRSASAGRTIVITTSPSS